MQMIGVIINVPIFTRKYLCWSLLLMKLQDFNVIKRESPTQAFSCEFQNKCLRSLNYGTHTVTTSENGWLISKNF